MHSPARRNSCCRWCPSSRWNRRTSGRTKSPEATDVTRPRRSGADVPSCASAGPSAVSRASAAADSDTPATRIVLCSCILYSPPLVMSLQPSTISIERARDLHCRLKSLFLSRTEGTNPFSDVRTPQYGGLTRLLLRSCRAAMGGGGCPYAGCCVSTEAARTARRTQRRAASLRARHGSPTAPGARRCRSGLRDRT